MNVRHGRFRRSSRPKPAIAASAETRLLTVGEKLSEISYHFGDEGSLGILYVDASPLLEIEKQFGGAAHLPGAERTRKRRRRRVARGATRDQRSDSILGRRGAMKSPIFLFRGAEEVEFYKRELPSLSRDVE